MTTDSHIMTSQRRLPGEGGFTIIEAMVAVTMLAVALVLTIQPLMSSLRRIADARQISVAENLAQSEIESLRALPYEDIGLPGRTPSGVLTASHVVTVEGIEYSIEVDVRYAGSLTGLEVIPQGGDGVEGAWDPGVDYKVVKVTVTAAGRESDPVVMETIVSPRSAGAHEGIANARVYLAAYEPFAPSGYELPALKIQASPAAPISSDLYADEQVFPAIPPGDYTVSIDGGTGWIIHPSDVLAGRDRIDVTAGTLAETTLRVYRPATLEVTVVDAVTGSVVASPQLAYKNLATGQIVTLVPGVLTAGGLIPDAYDLSVTASGYQTWTLPSVNIPSGYPDPVHRLTVHMQQVVATTTTTTLPSTTTTVVSGTTTTVVSGTTTTVAATTTTVAATTTTTTLPAVITVTLTVTDNTGRPVRGATVNITASNITPILGTTDDRGQVIYGLTSGTSYTASASSTWGHGPASATFDPGNTASVSLALTRPVGDGTMVLSGGRDTEFLYRIGSGAWKAIPVNFLGEASFVGGGTKTYSVAKRCLATGTVLGEKSVTLGTNEDRSTSISGKC